MTGGVTGESISVVIPTYNCARFLREAVESVFGQTVRPAEVIIVDDGSSDATSQLVPRLLAEAPRGLAVRYEQILTRAGSETARNTGIALTKSPWIAELDADDRWEPKKLERQLAFLDAWSGGPSIVVLGALGFHMNEDGRLVGNLDFGATTIAEFRHRRNAGRPPLLPHSSVLFAKEVFDRVGGYRRDYIGAEDIDLWSRMASFGTVLSVPERLIWYRKRSGSMQLTLFNEQQINLVRLRENLQREASGQPAISYEEMELRLSSRPLYQRLRRRRKLIGRWYYRQGSNHVVNGARALGSAELVLAAIADPGRVLNGFLSRLTVLSARSRSPVSSKRSHPRTS